MNSRNPALIALAALLASITALFVATSGEMGRSAAVSETVADAKTDPAAKGEVSTLPPRTDLFLLRTRAYLQLRAVRPGSQMDTLAYGRIREEPISFPLLVNLVVVRIDRLVSDGLEEPDGYNVFFAVDQKQTLAIQLARSRGYNLTFLIRGSPSTHDHYSIDVVIEKVTLERTVRTLDDSRVSWGHELVKEVGTEAVGTVTHRFRITVRR
jgi:hypothetical protein